MAGLKILCLALILASIPRISLSQNIVPTLLVHGGAGDVSDESIPFKKIGVKLAARVGYETLKKTGSVVEAVQQAVQSMEENDQFNSGYGSVLTWEGDVEMDASIMDGSTLNAGCVSLAKDILHPIALARSVMEKTRHMYLAGEGAMAFAVEEGFEILPEGSLVTEKSKKALEDYKNSLNGTSANKKQKSCPEIGDKIFGSPGTVGAVAIDAYGNVAAATSTGGITGKMPGRIGDSPILGGGTYADNDSGCVSATGQGETIMRFNVASKILALIEHFGMSAQDATAKVLEEMTHRFNQTAGVISIDGKGNLGIYFTSRRMSWAYQRGEELHYGIDKDEDIVEIVGEPRVEFL
ncbi:probable isoaspartyl peptidase/L-asparaginase GA20639 [Stomoxys calcitrans]|uniref:probable isoaspartyl peptidase/L-asparaginase GA20639 n=1 Tax=Stomoxys calcitrans TaxID=35570 RepID=UPI0027E33AA1|nr:probable isoaspartyl peptidase/L-asparaginase GA20639 [Stomoxys calcitrans]